MGHSSHTNHSSHGNHSNTGSHSLHTNHGSTGSHSLHTNHGNTGTHSLHTNHSNTGHGPVSISWPQWSAGISVGDKLENTINKVKEIRDNIQYIRDNKGPSSMPAINLSSIGDSSFNPNITVARTQYMALKDSLDTMFNAANSTSSAAPVKYVGDIIYRNDINTIKTETDNIASLDAHSSHSSHNNHGNHSSHGNHNNHGNHSSHGNHNNHGNHSSTGSHSSHTNHSSSDKKLKYNINKLNYSLRDILKLNPVRYNWKKNNKEDIGLIAQEVKEVIPEVVLENDKGYLSIDYGRLTVILIQAIKEIEGR